MQYQRHAAGNAQVSGIASHRKIQLLPASNNLHTVLGTLVAESVVLVELPAVVAHA